MDDVFASCTEELARAAMRQGVFEWEASAELVLGLLVTLTISWQPEYDGPLADLVASARASWERLRATERSHRQTLVAEICRQYYWVRVQAEDISPEGVWFLPDGSAEVAYGRFVDGEHEVIVEVSPAGGYAGWRAE